MISEDVLPVTARRKRRQSVRTGAASGLGWIQPCSAPLAAPDRMVSVLRDGAYMFANPTACHLVAETQNCPSDGDLQHALEVRAACNLDMYDKGVAAEGGGRLLPTCRWLHSRRSSLRITAGERVERPVELPAALACGAANATAAALVM